MSDSLRFNLILVAAVFLIAFSLVMSVAPEGLQSTIVASPYCAKTMNPGPLKARAIYVEDLSRGAILYEDNADSQLPLASLTKIVTALTASEILELDQTIEIPEDALLVEGDSGLVAHEAWRVRDLIDFTLIESSNDGSRALAESAAESRGEDLSWFTNKMNEFSERIGLSQAFFVNDSGLDISSTTAGAYGSARDVALVLAYASREGRGVLDGSSNVEREFVSQSGLKHTASNTSDISRMVAGARITKTGFTDLAGGNLGVVFDAMPGRPVVAVILGSTRDERDIDMKRLIDAARTQLRVQEICASYVE